MDFDQIYREGAPPWDIGGPQPALHAVIDHRVQDATELSLPCFDTVFDSGLPGFLLETTRMKA